MTSMSFPAIELDQRRPADDLRTVPQRPPVGRAALAGFLIVGLGFGGFSAWATLAPLASAAVAPGVVTVDGNRKVVQHLEGGIIAELAVHNGDRVRAGQVLVRLDDLEARSLHALLEGQYVALAAQEARLLTEREMRETLIFPAVLEARRHRPTVHEILAGQERIFASGRDALKGQIDVLRQRIAQLQAQIAALQAQRQSGAVQLTFIAEELAGVKELFDKGFERKPRLLALLREAASLEGQQGEYEGRMAQAREAIAEAELEILNAKRSRVKEAAVELREIQMRKAEIEERLSEAAAKLNRRDVIAPQAGVVLNLRYHTLGGVVSPGESILDLVPEDDRLIVEARVSPTDIDVVHAGLPARVALTAYKGRTTPQLDGEVLQVSADALADNRTGQSYFLARIGIDTEQLRRLSGVALAPGMPAEAFIASGERTLLDYLIQPLTDSFRHAFRED
jgi:HlyD family type I secretion membrane fusion protein